MFEIKDELKIKDVLIGFIKDSANKAVMFEPKIGDRFRDASDPYDKSKCLELEKELNDHGFKTRVAQNIERKYWSVAIIE